MEQGLRRCWIKKQEPCPSHHGEATTVQSTNKAVGPPFADAAFEVLVHALLAWLVMLAMIQIQ